MTNQESTGTISIPEQLQELNFRRLAAKGNVHDGDDPNHGETIAAKPHRDYRNELDAEVNVVLNHHLPTKRRVMKET